MTKNIRNYSFLDELCLQFDQTLRVLAHNPQITQRPNPAENVSESPLSISDAKHAAGLMRVNHVGEVCAQALYQGQALTARDPHIKSQLQHAADEENDHLAWCQQRLIELKSHTSFLNIVWYLGALSLGVAAGLAGDRWSLGFLAETEDQVVKHLESHLRELPPHDAKSRAIVTQMAIDERHHEKTAIAAGAAVLPALLKSLMRFNAKIMTTTAYWI